MHTDGVLMPDGEGRRGSGMSSERLIRQIIDPKRSPATLETCSRVPHPVYLSNHVAVARRENQQPNPPVRIRYLR